MFDEELFRAYALRFVGQPYIWGGDTPMQGWDCSGLVQEILAAFGADFPGDQTAQELFYKARLTWQNSRPSVGSVAFYGKSPDEVTHVAIFLNATVLIEAGGGNSNTLTKEEAIKRKAYVRIRPITHRNDFVGILKPRYS